MSWSPKRLTREQMEERRMEGAKLLRQGKMTQEAIAQRLGVSRMSVNKWKQQLKAEGLRGLKARRSGGRPGKLTKAQQQQLVQRLRQGAIAAGFPSDRWTLRRVGQVIRREFGVEYHPKYLGRLLKGLGWTRQIPQDQAAQRDEELVQAWLKRDWPRIKKITSLRNPHCVYG